MKTYKIILTKAELAIDEDELPNVLKGISSGNTVAVKQGMFNPSYFVAITEDRERNAEVFERRKTNAEYLIPSLKNIFDNKKLLN